MPTQSPPGEVDGPRRSRQPMLSRLATQRRNISGYKPTSLSPSDLEDKDISGRSGSQTVSPSDSDKHKQLHELDVRNQNIANLTFKSQGYSHRQRSPLEGKEEQESIPADLRTGRYPPPPFPKANSDTLIFRPTKEVPLLPLEAYRKLCQRFAGFGKVSEKSILADKVVCAKFRKPENAYSAIKWFYRDLWDVLTERHYVVFECQTGDSDQATWEGELKSWKSKMTNNSFTHREARNTLFKPCGGKIGGGNVMRHFEEIDESYPLESLEQRTIRFVIDTFQELEEYFRGALRNLKRFPTTASLARRNDRDEILATSREMLFMALSRIWQMTEHFIQINKVYWFHPRPSRELLAIQSELRPIRNEIIHNVGQTYHRHVDFEEFHRFLNKEKRLATMHAEICEVRRTWSKDILEKVRIENHGGMRATKAFLKEMEPLLLGT